MVTSHQSIVAEQLRLLLKSPFPIFAAGLTAVLALIILRDQIDPALLFGWGAVMLAWQGVRYGVWRRFRRRGAEDRWAIAWVWPINILMTGCGLLWGVFAAVFYQVQDFETRVFMLFVVTSMMTGGSVSFTSYLPAYYGYLLGATLPIAVAFLWHGTSASLLMGAMTGVYIAVLLIMARAANRGVTHLIELQLEKAALVSDLREAKESAERASRVKSQFLAHMSHELRTPLNAIIGFSDVIRSQLFGPVGNTRYEDYVVDINRSGNLLLRLVNDILDVSKLEAQAMELVDDIVDIAQVAKDCLKLVKTDAAAKELALALDLPHSLPRLRADELRLKQVLLNLLSNAVKFSRPGGTVVMSARLLPDGALALSVRDSGIGMSEADIKIALQPFRQVENTRTRHYAGTGLGLPLAKSLVERHGGGFRIESACDVGTTVAVVLPAERVIMDPLFATVPIAAAS